jgi:hypothetical protein
LTDNEQASAVLNRLSCVFGLVVVSVVELVGRVVPNNCQFPDGDLNNKQWHCIYLPNEELKTE